MSSKSDGKHNSSEEEPMKPEVESSNPEVHQVNDNEKTTTSVDDAYSGAMEKADKDIPNEDIEYVSDANAALLMKTPRGGRLLIYTMLLALVSTFIWASHAQLDEITRGMGIVIPSSRLQVVQNLEGGILDEVFVQEGEQVVAGQPLMQLDDTRFASSFRESDIEFQSEMAKAARLKAELYGDPLVFPEELMDHPDYVSREKDIFKQRTDRLSSELEVASKQIAQAKHELASAKEQLSFLTTSFELGQDELELTVPLAEQGVVSKVELIQLQQRVNDLESEKRRTELSIPKVKASYQESLARKDEIMQKYRSEVAQELKETEVHLDQLSESHHALEDQVERTLVRSPMDGIVKKIHINTIGGVVQPGMSLLEIVPLEDNLLIEAQIQPKDIGFLRQGMRAIVKLTAYDFAIYGGLEGEVEHISADTIKDEKGESFYIVRIKTENNYVGAAEKPLVIIPGMRTNVDIITGDKTIMDYLLKPILRAKQNALTER